jgi:hypothetical protein
MILLLSLTASIWLFIENDDFLEDARDLMDGESSASADDVYSAKESCKSNICARSLQY